MTAYRTVRMDANAVTMAGGQLDPGGYHRALAVARELGAAGLWDGYTPITIFDPYATHGRLFGPRAEPATALQAGKDYQVTP